MAKRSTVVWFTGLPSSGKTALARRVRERLRGEGVDCVMLDGDEVRDAIVPRHGHDDAGRGDFDETLARLAAVHARQGIVVLVPATANRAAYRARARSMTARFIEVHVNIAVDEARKRDAHKGLYDAGVDLPGQGAPFEAPESPDVVVAGARDDRDIDAIVEAIGAEPESEAKAYVALSVRPSPELDGCQAALCDLFELAPRKELHITLAYLGDLPWDRLLQAGTALRRVPAITAPLELALSGTGGAARVEEGSLERTLEALSDPAKARVAWWSVAPDARLARLRDNVVRVLTGNDFGIEAADEFYPHITVGSNKPEPNETHWDVHDVPKGPAFGLLSCPKSVVLARLHLTSPARAPASSFVLRHLCDD